MNNVFLLPPVNAEAINTTDARFGIADSMLLTSSVPELPPAAYSGAVTYVLGDQANTGTVGELITVWQSLQNGNIGHAPAVSPTYWKMVGETYADWNAAASWPAESRVLRAVAGVHAVFQRLAPGGVDGTLPETDELKWTRVATTPRWAMFDMLSAEPTVAVSPLTFTLAPGRISGLALLAADVGNVHVTVHSGIALVYEAFDTFDSTPVENWDDYFFAEFATRSNILMLDLPTYSDGVITVTITSDSGSILLGKTIVGTGQVLGAMRKGAKIRRRSLSTVDRDSFGEITGIKRRKSIPLISAQLNTEKAIVLRAKAALDTARTTPCVFAGLTAEYGAYAELLTFLAICTDSEVDLSEVNESIINVELEGI